MSWNDYITTMTSKGGQQCGIYTKQGAQCAQSQDFNLSPAEIQALAKCLAGSGGEVKIEINGQPCAIINYDKDDCSVMVKTKKPALADSKVFYHVEATKEYLIVCGMTGAGERGACKISHDICDHLKAAGH